MNTLELDQQLNTLIITGQSEEAFRRFYAEDVVSQENDEPERVGREEWMNTRMEAEKNMKDFQATLLAHAANESVSFSEWLFLVEMEGLGRFTVSQVAVRRWKNGRVVHERFYHK